MATTTDYTGRMVDLLMLQGTTSSGVAEVDLALADSDGKSYVTTGIQKISQRFLIGLMTELGSQTHEPGFGTLFMIEVKYGAANSSAKFQIAFRNAAAAIIAQQNTRLTGNEPDDEVLTEANLVSYSFPTPDRIIMNVELTSRAGSSRVVVLPVTLAIR